MLFFIVGITGVGKSTHGKKVAKKMGYSFIDLDALIEMRNRMRLFEIFDYGESIFRLAETKALMSIDTHSNHIVATGGGIVEVEENIKYMKENGVVVLLKRPIQEIYDTISFNYRPLLRDNPQLLWDIYEKRKPMYEKAADIVFEVETGFFDVDLIATQLLKIESNISEFKADIK